MFKAFAFLVMLMSAAYGIITAYPGMFFSSSHTYKNITIHSHEPLKAGVDDILGQVSGKISTDDFSGDGQKFDVYLSGGYGEYAFFAPFCRKEYSCLHPLTDKLFMACADFEKKRAYSPADQEKGRPLEAVLTRALVRSQIRKKMLALNYLLLSDWKTEGYAEHVAGETEGMAPSEICPERAAADPALRHMKYRLMVELIREEDKLGFPGLMKANYSYESAEKRVKKKSCP